MEEWRRNLYSLRNHRPYSCGCRSLVVWRRLGRSTGKRSKIMIQKKINKLYETTQIFTDSPRLLQQKKNTLEPDVAKPFTTYTSVR